MQDRTVVECRPGPVQRVSVNYRIRQEGQPFGEYQREEMTCACRGLYYKTFLLFFGETLQYEIWKETADGAQAKVAEEEITKDDTPSDVAQCRYEMINDILLADALEDYGTLDWLLEEYRHRDYLSKNLFRKR